MKSIVFGPVPSRRLGFSLGVDLIPRKYCSFDCIYCQLGTTPKTEVERQSFYDPELVVRQVVERVKKGGRIDCVSLSGSGEPTLNGDIGWIIRRLKEEIALPVAVITNSSLLIDKDVRTDIRDADIVLPSLDAATEAVYRQINRPHESLGFGAILEGLKTFCREYKGKVWLEIMLINNINNAPQHVEIFNEILRDIPVNKIQLNTVVRPPAEKNALPVEETELLSLSRSFRPPCEIIAGDRQEKGAPAREENMEEAILAMVRRRSLSLDDIVTTTGLARGAARETMKKLTGEKRVRPVLLRRRRFYIAVEDDNSQN
jgi:wyosine [tRNA(Phe)-imidazoG37] synthetase (radical SAM superfamily)